jgi:amino acid adenylation domain-containing protein
LTSEVRILQFASFVFDLCIGEIVGPLMAGACLCVPSDEVRMNDITSFIAEKDINWAFLTPAFVRTLKPEDVPSLELLLLAGEAVGSDIFQTWFGKLRLINAWGPAETCVFSTLHEWQSAEESPLTIGKSVGSSCWIVEPEDSSKLAPIGCLGEVIIQGPTLLQEYLADPLKNKATIITDLPMWIPNGSEIHWSRFFKSGDLCRYNEDGSMQFVSRKDTQVKIRGLRVELGEVEHHMRSVIPDIKHVLVDLFKRAGTDTLIAYFSFNEDSADSNLATLENTFIKFTSAEKSQLAGAVGKLHTILPSYMVPTVFVPCKTMPSVTSTKLDRRALCNLFLSLNESESVEYLLTEALKRSPETEMEVRLQQIWASTLGISSEQIGRDDSFLRIGGDSITVIQMVSAAREADINLSVQDIFSDPRLLAVSRVANKASIASPVAIKPFELMPPGQLDGFMCEFEADCALPSHMIEDAYPCTGLQEGLIALSTLQPGSYVAKYVYALGNQVDIDRFKSSWDETVRLCTNLRTRLVTTLDSTTCQAIVKDGTEWDSTEGFTLNEFMKKMQTVKMTYGSSLCRYALITETDNRRYFALAIHHSIFDGWSLNLVLETLHDVYHNKKLQPLQPFSSFISYTSQLNAEKAKAYWSTQLSGAQKAELPSIGRKSDNKPVTRVVKSTMSLSRSADESITKATVLRAAWAIVLSQYCSVDDVCFGTSISGRFAPLSGIDRMIGPTVATVPIRIQLDRHQSIKDLLQQIQQQASAMTPYEQFGLKNISKISNEVKEACDFTSLLVIQPAQHVTHGEKDDLDIMSTASTKEYSDEDAASGYFTYPLVVQVLVYDNEVDIVVTYNANILKGTWIQTMQSHFRHVIQQLTSLSAEMSLESLSLVHEHDLDLAVSYNSDIPELVQDCVHHLVEEQARSHPNSIAIKAWDAQFTYSQLNAAADRLAIYLLKLRVKSGDLIHTCFEKSAWFFVAMLAINKTGSAWVPLDPSHPVQRHKQILSQTRAKRILCSPDNLGRCRQLVDHVLGICAPLDEELSASIDAKTQTQQLPRVSSENAAYVLFTSGSTGTPKGLVMQHYAVCTSQRAIANRLGLTRGVRILQFASFVFDLCIGEIIGPLITGATVCVPSEDIRMNSLPEFIAYNQVTWAFLTPAFIRTLSPEMVPTIKLVLLAGEAVGQDILDVWFGHVRLINGWGPAETCVFSTLHEWNDSKQSPLTIGRPVGSACWIVDQDDASKLAPIGSVGEVIIQGPTLLREYLSDETRTELAVIQNLPTWIPNKSSQLGSRAFKSGDLCRYNPDGTIEFVGRKDNQVKIRGLRVELGEIEQSLRLALPEIRQVVVDVFKIGTNATLVAYFASTDETRTLGENSATETEDMFLPLQTSLKSKVGAAIGQLRIALPSYMVPAMYIPCRYMPTITSTKIDRRSLLTTFGALSESQLAEYSLSDTNKRPPETEKEVRLQKIWAVILKRSTDLIGRDDSFLHVGGDSITAIQSVVAARQEGLLLTVKDIFDDPRLLAVAAKAVESDSGGFTDIAPFSLVSSEYYDEIKDILEGKLYSSATDHIQDLYPCTNFQEGLMALSVKQPGSYIAKYVYELPKSVNLDLFRKSWEQTLEQCPNLRTRMIHDNGKPIQAVIGGPACWDSTNKETLISYMAKLKDLEMSFETPLCRYALLEENGGRRFFVLTLHHAIFDGWSLNIVIDTLFRFYHRSEVSKIQGFSGFVDYVSQLDQQSCREYWEAELSGARQALFPPASPNANSRAKTMKASITFPTLHNKSITPATIIRAAWGILLARYSDTDDICFGTTVSGRQAPIPAIDRVAGPTVATVPVRFLLDRQEKVSSFLHKVQNQALEMVPFEQFGLQNIAKLNSSTKEACGFTSLLVIQPTQHVTSINDTILLVPDINTHDQSEAMESYFTFPLVVEISTGEDSLDLHFTYQPLLVPELRLTALTHHLSNIMEQLANDKDILLGDISVAGHWDLQQALNWNTSDNSAIQACVPDLITERAKVTPNSEAVYATHDSLTYSELDYYSSLFAGYLMRTGLEPQTPVAVCLEKSTWTVVAMLGVMKAGAIYVPMDPTHPKTRHHNVLRDLKIRHLIVSSEMHAAYDSLVEFTIKVTSQLKEELRPDSEIKLPKLSPFSPAYIITTSGSTGFPKSIIVDHSALATTTLGHGRAYNFTQKSRVLQFSSCVFDVSLSEILETLVLGGTVCIPSESERLQNITEFIRGGQVNTALLTSTFLRTVNPHNVPSLKHLILVGEAPSKDVIDMWHGHVDVLANAYGPSEVSVFCTSHVYKSVQESATTIGRAFGCSSFIVEPGNHQQLAPIACVGELLVYRQLAQGYLNDDEKTKQSFLDTVDWFPTHLNDSRKLFKTGDLVRYSLDGTMEYIGRRDTQVKLRGYRIELGEVEYNVKRVLSNVKHVAVDVLQQKNSEILVAFVTFNDKQQDASRISDLSDWLMPTNDLLKKSFITAIAALRDILPGYMVPSLFFPIQAMPLGTSLKLDRKKLHTLATNLEHSQLIYYAIQAQEWEAPTSGMELKLRDIWAQILNIDAERIGKNDSFLEIGGDSISAIHLTSKAQECGLHLTVKDIFECSRLNQMALVVRNDLAQVEEVKPFSMLNDAELPTMLSAFQNICGIDQENIEDVFPCTSLQEGLIALSAKQPGSYIAKYVYVLHDEIDIARFRNAWEQTLRLCSILRARIISHKGRVVQSVLTETAHWEEARNLTSFLQSVQDYKMEYGSKLCRYAIINEADAQYFVLVLHHAVFDGWSLQVILDILHKEYHGHTKSPLQDYSSLIKYVTSIDRAAAHKYWSSQLSGTQKASFPKTDPTNQSQVAVSAIIRRTISLQRPSMAIITPATIIRAAWAIVLSQYSESTDICFGATVSGRHAPVVGIEKMVGPAITTVPIRVDLSPKMKVLEFLQTIQSQASEIVPYEQFGLQNISKIDQNARDLCNFSSLLVVQPAHHSFQANKSQDSILSPPSPEVYSATDEVQGYFTYPLVSQFFLSENRTELVLTYNSAQVPKARLQAMAEHLNTVIQCLTSATEESELSSVSLLSKWDIGQATNFNVDSVPEQVEDCIHNLIEKQACKRPDYLAIDAWDGQFSYSELDQAASRLANYLINEQHVNTGDLVHTCFDKSAWFFVAMLAINKAGAAWVPLDPTHPKDRHRSIVAQTGASLTLCSETNFAKCLDLTSHTVQVTPDFDNKLRRGNISKTPSSLVTPNHAAYVLFTSGSTGTPKGLVMRHGSLCTSQMAITERLRLTENVRMLQFASFVFDLCIGEIFGPLIKGGCLCIPSDDIRTSGDGLIQFISKMNINWVFLTPSFARTLRPADLPSLELMLLAGEAVGKDLLDTWFGNVRLINGWGPAETCVFSTLHEWTSRSQSPLTIGSPVGGACWIVNPQDTSQLSPIGCIGEVLIQGPTLLQEYLADPGTTNKAIIRTMPSWALNQGIPHWDRFFKSGDLGFYNSDTGTIEFVGRSDEQVKIRGFRVELGEVEHHLRSMIPGVQQVVVDILKRDTTTVLVSYFCLTNDVRATGSNAAKEVSSKDMLTNMTANIKDELLVVTGKLSTLLPSYMVPTLFIPCSYMPSITSTKLDRKTLRAVASSLTPDQISKYFLAETAKGKKRAPVAENEKQLQRV